MISIILFIIIYFFFCNWIQLYYLAGNLIKPGVRLTVVDGKGMLTKLNHKTGLKMTIKTMPEKNKMIGFMVSSKPFPPVMIFSERLYAGLNNDEFEWVALHESGHYLMWHNLKLALTQLSILFIGMIIINFLQNILLTPPLPAFLLGYVYIQLAKIFEYQADYYAVSNMDNPNGMITGNIKMSKVNERLMGGNSFRQSLIIAVSPQERIKMAEEEIEKRKIER